VERINWTREDWILALDNNGNGNIDNGTEVFSDYHLFADGTRAEDGFSALAQYDSNKDGKEIDLILESDGELHSIENKKDGFSSVRCDKCFQNA
jgi:hypothetical protein